VTSLAGPTTLSFSPITANNRTIKTIRLAREASKKTARVFAPSLPAIPHILQAYLPQSGIKFRGGFLKFCTLSKKDYFIGVFLPTPGLENALALKSFMPCSICCNGTPLGSVAMTS
jgi:hypothetical protein